MKSLNTMTAAVMVDPQQLPDPGSVFMSGDDADAKATVRRCSTSSATPT